MSLLKKLVIGYLVIGVLFALLFGGGINPFHLSTWGNVLLWLPLMLLHYFLQLIMFLVFIVIVLAVLSLFFPQVKAYLVVMGQKLRS